VELVEIEGSPWALMFEDAVKFDRMKSAASRLAKLLRPYKIEPRTIKLDNGSTAKGYHRADFEEACPIETQPSEQVESEAERAMREKLNENIAKSTAYQEPEPECYVEPWGDGNHPAIKSLGLGPK
jgi:Protein of unknown function (DUF3631).